jgi:hypothetical protein
MSSSEIIAAGQGFMWKAKMGYLLPIIGFDRYSAGVGEMSWRLGGLIPVAQAQGADVSRSARGRFVVELLLLPSALLPGPQVTWKELGENRAQVRVALDGETTLMELELRSDGRPKRAIVQRWSNFGSADGEWGFVPFAVNIEEEHCFGGYTIPTRLAAGWWGEDGWRFEFFRVEITQALFR